MQPQSGYIDLELTIDPAPPWGIFETMIFLYLMVCSIQNFFQSYGPLKYVTTSKIAIFGILNTKTSMYQVI